MEEPKSKLKYSEDYYIKTLLKKIKIEEIMAKKVISIYEDEPFSHVEEKFREFHIRHLPVVNSENKIVGIVTQFDLYRISTPHRDEEGNYIYDKEQLDSYILKEVMTRDPLTLTPQHTVGDALLVMVDKKYGSIPIVDKNNVLCGIVTQIDILRLGAQILREGEM